MPVYQDIQALKICFPSVAPYVDGAVVVDGAWKNYPSDVAWSTDGTPEFIEYCLRGKACTIIRLPERRECTEALNSVYQFIDNNYDVDHLWVVDWDCDWQLVPKDEDGATMDDVAQDFQDLKDGRYDGNKLIWMKFKKWRPDRDAEPDGYVGYHAIKGIRRKVNHYCIWDGEYEIKSFPDRYPHFVMPHSAIWHRFITRPKERILAQNDYYKHREEYVWTSSILSNNQLTRREEMQKGYDLNLIFPNDKKFKDYHAETPKTPNAEPKLEQPEPLVDVQPAVKLPIRVVPRRIVLTDLVTILPSDSTRCRLCNTDNNGDTKNAFTFNFWRDHYMQKHPVDYGRMECLVEEVK